MFFSKIWTSVMVRIARFLLMYVVLSVERNSLKSKRIVTKQLK